MKILKKQVLNGPNIWSNYRKKLIQVRLDLEEMEASPSDKIPGFNERFKAAFPGMVSHECSEGVHGGFFARLERGTWMGHIMEHLALELQTLAGMEVGYGRTRGTAEKGVYNMVFAYEVEQAGLFAAESAFNIVNAFTKNETYDVDADIEKLRALGRRHKLGPSTKSIVDEAERRGIPWKRWGNNSKIQLGYGKFQKQFQATITCNTSSVAVNIAGDKDSTKQLLGQAGVPVPKGECCTTLEGLHEIIDSIGFPIVLKPLNGNQGKGATINVTSPEAAETAFEIAKQFCNYVIIEKYIAGSDYRWLVIDGKFVAASKRIPAHVVGNGKESIRELMATVNADPARGDGHESALTKIVYDKDTFGQLEKLGYTLESILAVGETVYLKSTANLSTGGTAVDVTDEMHPENIFLAERIAKIIGLDICGIDVMAQGVSAPIRKSGGAVIEVNAAPGFRMHLSPSEGKPRNVARAVVDMLFPESVPSTVPLFAVTGTNGKTTTTRLLAHIAKTAGYLPGYTTTDGIYIGDYKIQEGDTTGPLSARVILQDPTVEFAVLETARGGLLRGGLCFDQCDVGIITNIKEDHLGLNDINTLDDLANVKAVVARSVKESGYAVLNAEDENCVKIAGELDCKVVYFSTDNTNPLIAEHLQKGKNAAFIENNQVVIAKEGKTIQFGELSEIPLTQNGTARFMIDNVLAAVAAAYSYGIPAEQISTALKTFVPGYETTPGRMNLFEFRDFKVLVDYAHNPHGLLAMKDYLAHIGAARKIGIVAGIGDRRDADIVELAATAATMFDHIIIRQEHGLRGRTIEEINRLMIQGIESAGTGVTFDTVPEETQAIRHALNMAQQDDFVVALSDEYHKVIEVIMAVQEEQRNVHPIQLETAEEVTEVISA